MTYEELLINIDLKGDENVLPKIGKTCLVYKYWFVVCDEGDCHLFDRFGKEDNIKKVTTIYEAMIPKNVKKIVIPNSVTHIGNNAFWGCHELANVTIPNGLMVIGEYAFRTCINLTNLMIPNSVMDIGEYAFFNCKNLTSITIDKPIEQVRSMKNYPFGIEDESIIRCN